MRLGAPRNIRSGRPFNSRTRYLRIAPCLLPAYAAGDVVEIPFEGALSQTIETTHASIGWAGMDASKGKLTLGQIRALLQPSRNPCKRPSLRKTARRLRSGSKSITPPVNDNRLDAANDSPARAQRGLSPGVPGIATLTKHTAFVTSLRNAYRRNLPGQACRTRRG